ncbi:MAG: homocysteine S-methyltransferase family protein, partial [Acidimicrobiales bacterium]
MGRYDDLMGRITSGEKILIDGATGSEMQRRGVPEHTDGWYGGAALS